MNHSFHRKAVVSVWIGLMLFLTGWNTSALAQFRPLQLDDVPPPQPAPLPPSLGQQPFVVEQEQDLTPSQSNNTQLNQLFQFETTPDTSAAGEGYLSGNFDYLKFPGTVKQYRYEIQGQYAFTDQIAVGAFIPGITTHMNKTSSGLGDVGIYGQYKLDQFVNPQIVDLTAQLDVILPTGDISEKRDTGKFGVRPLILAYKDFGQHGPGDFGLYGLFGFTLTTNSDVRFGVAATYQYQNVVGILELFDQAGAHHGPFLQLTPGLAYRGLSPWEIAVGIPVGASHGTPDFGVILKFTYVFQN